MNSEAARIKYWYKLEGWATFNFHAILTTKTPGLFTLNSRCQRTSFWRFCAVVLHLSVLDQVLHHGWIGQCRDVPNLIGLVVGDLS